jgi:hypothetical protein
MPAGALYPEDLRGEVERQCGLAGGYDDLKEALASHIRGLLTHDFNRLVFILYRIDVGEERLRKLLKERPGDDAAELICSLILERLSQKAAARQKYGTPGAGESAGEDGERW